MTEPSDENIESPETTRAENVSGTLGRDVVIVILVIMILVGTIVLIRVTRERRTAAPPPAPANSPEALGLPSIEIAAELQSVAHRVLAAWRRDGAPPASLEGLPPDEDDPPDDPDAPSRRDPPLDFWGRPYVLERSDKDGRVVLTLITHGADGEPGGVGNAQDVVMEIEAPEM